MARQQHLDAAVCGEGAEPIEVGWLVVLQPLEQRPGEVQDHREEVSPRKPVEQGPVDVLDVLREDVIEVAHRLVEVQTEDEADGIHQAKTREREPPSAAATAVRMSGKTWSRRDRRSASVWARGKRPSSPGASAAISAWASSQ